MAAIREQEIVLEVCPTSNLLTGALAGEEDVRFTFRRFLEHDVPFTVATDGPEMMQTHLRDELELLLRIGAADEDDLRAANARGHEASFIGAPAARRLSPETSPGVIPRKYIGGCMAARHRAREHRGSRHSRKELTCEVLVPGPL